MKTYHEDPVVKAGYDLKIKMNRVRKAGDKLREEELAMYEAWDYLEEVAAQEGREVPGQYKR